MRWIRDGDLLTVQWRDNKTISLMSNHHSAKGYSFVARRTKVNGEFRRLLVRQPNIVKDYNKSMGGVDRSDQLINKYNVLRKTNKYWKTLFFHFIDIARVNSYILFEEWRKTNPNMFTNKKRPKKYLQLQFTEELIRDLCKLAEFQEVPLADNAKITVSTCYKIDPQYSDKFRNCTYCYKKSKVEHKVKTMCGACNTHLCFNAKRNCLREFHLPNK